MTAPDPVDEGAQAVRRAHVAYSQSLMLALKTGVEVRDLLAVGVPLVEIRAAQWGIGDGEDR